MPNAAFGETAGTDPMPDAAFEETAGPEEIPDAAFVETASPGPIAGDLEGVEEAFGQAATEAAQGVDVGMATIPDLQWYGEDAALNQDLPFTGRANSSQIESTLSPLWRLATRLIGDPTTREAGRQLRQRFAYFATTPGAIETLLSLIPVLGEQEDQELLDGPLDAVDPGANQLGAILEYLPVVRPTQDVGVLTTDLVAHHSEQQARALTGLFLHTIGITSVDVRTMIGNENLGLMQRAFWRGRELLIQQLGAWMFRCINSFQTLRALDGQWALVLGATELPTTLQAPGCPAAGRASPDFSGKAASNGRGTAATDPGPRRGDSSDRLGRYGNSCCTRPRGDLQLDRSFGWLGSKHRQGRATTKASTEYRFAARGSAPVPDPPTPRFQCQCHRRRAHRRLHSRLG